MKAIKTISRTFALCWMAATAILFPPLQQALASGGGRIEVKIGDTAVPNTSHEGIPEEWPPEPDPNAAGRRVDNWIKNYSLRLSDEGAIDTVDELCAFGLAENGGYGCVTGPFRHLSNFDNAGNMYCGWGPEDPVDPYHVEFVVPIYFAYYDPDVGQNVLLSSGIVAYNFDQPTGRVGEVLVLNKEGVTRILDTEFRVDTTGVAHVEGTLTVSDSRETYSGGWTSEDNGETWEQTPDTEDGFTAELANITDACDDMLRCDPVTALVVIVVVAIVFVACFIFCWMFWYLLEWDKYWTPFESPAPFHPLGQPALALV